MRIIGGHLGGRRLRAPRGDDTRPTSDRVREAVFNILGPPPAGARVLDVFAGAGALGLEALSRGAALAVFADTAQAACRCVRENARALALEHAVRVHRGDAIALIARLTENLADSPDSPDLRGGPFHWVFLDPPYRSDLAARALSALGSGALVAPGGIVVVEHDRRRPPDARYGCLIRTDCRRYGDTSISLYRRQENTTMTAPASTTAYAVYPGTFDPVTNGHIDILERGLRLFDRMIVAIATNPRKQPLFTIDERQAFIASALGDQAHRVELDAFEGLLVDYCTRRGATCIVRGLRALADFEYEFQFAHMNRRLAPSVDTVFLMTDERHHYVSSSLVKEVASFGGDVSGLVPPAVERALREKYRDPEGK